MMGNIFFFFLHSDHEWMEIRTQLPLKGFPSHPDTPMTNYSVHSSYMMYAVQKQFSSSLVKFIFPKYQLHVSLINMYIIWPNHKKLIYIKWSLIPD